MLAPTSNTGTRWKTLRLPEIDVRFTITDYNPTPDRPPRFRSLMCKPYCHTVDGYCEKAPIGGRVDLDKMINEWQSLLFELLKLGVFVRVVELHPDDRHPDATFTFDWATVLQRRGKRPLAVKSRFASDNHRRFEPEIFAAATADWFDFVAPPDTFEGRPVLKDNGDFITFEDGGAILVGSNLDSDGGRTNSAGVEWLRDLVRRDRSLEYEVFSIPCTGLHLTTGASPLYNGKLAPPAIVAAPMCKGKGKIPCGVEMESLRRVLVPFGDYREQPLRIIEAAEGEPWAANLISAVGLDGAIAADGYPGTRQILEKHGFKVRPVPFTQAVILQGSPWCQAPIYRFDA